MKSKIVYLSLCACLALEASENLEAITITSATKSEKRVDGVAASVIVITQEEIQNSHAGRLRDLFENLPSLTLQNGAFPSASAKNKSALSIRGLGSSGTLLLIDGKRLAGEVKNPYDLDRIPLSIIERIEIIKGSSSALYGSDAMGGVINIITKAPTKEVEGSFGLRGESSYKGEGFEGMSDLDIRGKKEKFSYALSGSILEGAGQEESKVANVYAKHPVSGAKVKPSTHPLPALQNNVKDFYAVQESLTEEATVYNLNTKFQYEFTEALTAGVDFSFMKEEREGDYIGNYHPSNYGSGGNKIPLYNIPVKSEDSNRRTHWGTHFKAKLTPDLTLFGQAYQSKYKKRNSTSALYWEDMGYASKEASASNGMDANVKVSAYESYLQYLAAQSHLLTLGGEYRDETREGTVFNQEGTMETKKVDYKAFYFQDEWEASDRWNWLFGVRYDDISNADSKTTFKIGTHYALSDSLRLRSSFSQGYRTADIRELYISKQTPVGLQLGSEVIRGVKTSAYDLKPEFVNAYEIGLGGRLDAWSYDLALFYNDIKDKIEMVRYPAYYTFENIADARALGIEATLGYAWSDSLKSSLGWMELRSENRETKEDLLLTPLRTVRLKTEYEPLPRLILEATLRHVGAQEYELSDLSDNVHRYKAKADTFLDLSIDYTIEGSKRYKLFGGMNNVLGEKVDENILANRGRVMYAGLRYFF